MYAYATLCIWTAVPNTFEQEKIILKKIFFLSCIISYQNAYIEGWMDLPFLHEMNGFSYC